MTNEELLARIEALEAQVKRQQGLIDALSQRLARAERVTDLQQPFGPASWSNY